MENCPKLPALRQLGNIFIKIDPEKAKGFKQQAHATAVIWLGKQKPDREEFCSSVLRYKEPGIYGGTVLIVGQLSGGYAALYAAAVYPAFSC
ncbi:hypothetical protein [Larkinella sp. C7]|uniref:hypothetical protein n=1 Tax=Larkinella sp. C7 TaxID=2576607 RepID=UPI0011115A09|nr:hypothetical protein [Larkinella sp. C7]